MRSAGPSSRTLQIVRVVGDQFAVIAALSMAVGLRFGLGLLAITESSPLTPRSHVVAGLLWLGALTFFLCVNRLYDEDTLIPGAGEIARVIRSHVEAAAAFALLVFLSQSFYVSRSWFGLTFLLSGALVITTRLGLRSLISAKRRTGAWLRPIVLVSSQGLHTRLLIEKEFEFLVVAAIEPQDLASFLLQNQPPEMIAKRTFRGVPLLLRQDEFERDDLWRLVIEAGRVGHPVFIHSPVRSVRRDRLTVRELGGRTIVKVAPATLTGLRALQKRALDLIAAVALSLVLVPLLILIAVGILMDSGLPILYRQQRVGFNGQPFVMFKFRTMRPDAEVNTGPVWATVNDDRMTRLGAYLRRLSLDELPQLWNVVRGEMSLVGPRPERATFVSRFRESVDWYEYRDRIRPGMTGWAQAHGLRGNTSLDSRVEFDNWYIENWSIWLDLRILIRTFGEIIRGERAT